MPINVESATYINQLNTNYPTQNDNVADGDNHIRLIKSTLQATFSGITGEVTGTHTAINSAVAAANAATNANTASTIVKRDASGNFTAGTITAALTGNVTGDVTGNVTGNVTGDVTGNVTGNVSGDAGTVNGKTVGKNVPADALFTDTNTFRAITSTPANNATSTSISSHWAYNNVKTAVPINALFTDTNTTYTAGAGISLSNGEFSANGSAINAGQVDGFSISTEATGTTANVIYFRT